MSFAWTSSSIGNGRYRREDWLRIGWRCYRLGRMCFAFLTFSFCWLMKHFTQVFTIIRTVGTNLNTREFSGKFVDNQVTYMQFRLYTLFQRSHLKQRLIFTGYLWTSNFEISVFLLFFEFYFLSSTEVTRKNTLARHGMH